MDCFGPNPQNYNNLTPRDLRSYERIGVGRRGSGGGSILKVFRLFERGLERGLEREERIHQYELKEGKIMILLIFSIFSICLIFRSVEKRSGKRGIYRHEPVEN